MRPFSPRLAYRRRAERAGNAFASSLQRQVRKRARWVWPPIGFARFRASRRLTPVSRTFGGDRGQPIDRHYIQQFLSRHAGKDEYLVGDIRGHVLEIGDDYYTRRFGGWGKESSFVEKVDILHADESNPTATIVGNLTSAEQIADDTFDCVICTQTLLLIYDIKAATRTLHRILKPDGILLATAPGISQLCRPDVDRGGDYWRFTSLSFRRLFEEVFPPENVTVEAYGNVLTSVAFLWGLAAEELKGDELAVRDPDYELLVTARAQK